MTPSIFRAPSAAAVEAFVREWERIANERHPAHPITLDEITEARREVKRILPAAHAITVREVLEACAAMFDQREREALAGMEKNPVGSIERALDADKAVGWGRAARALRAPSEAAVPSSESVLLAEDDFYRALAATVRGEAERGGPWTDLLLRLRAAQHLASVIAARREIVEACIEVAKRVRTAEENRHLAEDRDRSRVPALVDAAHHCGEAIEVALRALLPDAAPTGGG